LDESLYIHNFLINSDDVKEAKKALGKNYIMGLDSDKAGILMHIYGNPDIIEVSSQLPIHANAMNGLARHLSVTDMRLGG